MTHARTTNNQIMLVFDASPETQTMLLDSLMTSQRNDETRDPFWIYYRILNGVIVLHDKSIWDLRDQVRDIERSYPNKSPSDESIGKGIGERSKPNYRVLHDLARHAIHIAETTSVTVNVIKGIHAAHREYLSSQSTEGLANLRAKSIQKRVQDQLLLYDQLAVGLQNRAEAVKDRLHNEIQLSFNTVTQEDAATTIQISLIAQTDSRVMRMIAYLTLAFLPATFVSAIFSTSFFNFNPEHQKYSVSKMFWVYWVFAALVTVGMFYMFRRWGPSQSRTAVTR
ncbi:Mg2+ transporter protein, CorA-like/Zinc transport protein ZntB [Beauveria brongniartii RCEF 3172]|uniref:Mg2+ transporter protein, CorA-like/Zinc transport protein ZntB n=1 Tax=Beauveria brongniartii RCEF 3172 TaxID=1081107 RepID=A0A166XAF5_9HYPO|nr:Mg2+ transporter protein, CorA-like/Zinc transport protein ZntB [Beauveria brongniartii RCEF 3172]